MGKDHELIEAARNGDIHVVDKLLTQRAKRSGPLASLRRGPGANAQDSSGFSALHHAAVNRHKNIVELLLSHEASTNIVDLQGSSPLHLAAWSGNEEIVRLLLTHGPSQPNINLMNQSLETALHMAAQFGHLDVVRLLLHHGANPAITNSKQETALDLAAQYGRLETVQLLLKSHPELLAAYTNPNLSPRHVFPHTPLHLASRNGHRSVVEVLVRAGFEVNCRTVHGTALHEAALCGKVDVVKSLLEAKIDVCVADSARRTAVDRLSEVGLKTPVAKEIAELIRGALKESNIQLSRDKLLNSLNHESVHALSKDGKLPLSQIYDNHSNSDVESSRIRHSYSPKSNNFTRDKTRRSLDVYLPKGPDFDKSIGGPPKKPPRRNLSASPTHPDFSCADNNELLLLAHLGRNKSLDEGVYAERWRKSAGPSMETSQSSDSIDMSPVDHHYIPGARSSSRTKSDITFFYGLVTEELKQKSKSQNLQIEPQDTQNSSSCNSSSSNNYVSVAHIKLRDAKSEQNVSPGDSRLKKDGVLKVSADQTHVSQNVQVSSVTVKGENAQISTEKCSPPVTKPKPLPKGPKPVIAPKPIIAPKPKIIKRQGHSCENVLDGNSSKSSTPRKQTQKSTSMSILTPTDLDKDWEGITEFMNSLSIKIDSDSEEPTTKTPIILLSPVGRWLASFDMTNYEKLLVSNGFDDIQFLGEGILDDSSLLEIGMLNAQHRKILVDKCSKLPVSWPKNRTPESLKKWLQDLHLEQYEKLFEKNFYTDPERIVSIWNEELTTVLEIDSLGHRRRLILAGSRVTGPRPKSSPRRENGVDEAHSDGSLPLRDPNDLVSGVSPALKTAWRHTPETLIDGSVTYRAIYIGSCYVQEFSTTQSIQKAISEIRTGEIERRNREKSTPLVHKIEITLIVSASIVSWYNAKTKALVSEHEVGSIQCTCQASDDLRHVALVTKDNEQTIARHSCHVFCLDSVEIATEAILTLGQAFEVAYQLALSQRKHYNDGRGHIRSKSANQLSSATAPYTQSATSSPSAKMKNEYNYNSRFVGPVPGNNAQQYHQQQHNRSHSVTEIQLQPMFGITKSASNSPRVHPTSRFPRAESFSPSSQSSQPFTRAPIVSKEEL